MEVFMKTSICFVSSTRADYSLLLPSIKECLSRKSKGVKTSVIVTGSHTIKSQGETINHFKKDKIPISYSFKILDKTDSKGVKDNFKKSFDGFFAAYEKIKPDVVVLLGDRYEIFCAAVTAHMKGIKVVHLHGGELTLGAYDDAYRHSITKFSYLHFTASKNYRKRVIQLGENPRKVFNVGPLARESISHVKFLKKSELEKRLKLKLKQNVILATFHPEIGSEEKNKQNLMNFIHVLGELENVSVLFTSPNLDFLGNEVKKLLKEKIRDFENIAYYESLGFELYYSLMRFTKCVVGNSSSGIIEAPIMGVSSINIGKRQEGRDQEKTTVNSSFNKSELKNKIEKVLQQKKQSKKNIKNVSKPSKIIVNKIIEMCKKDISKKFYDL